MPRTGITHLGLGGQPVGKAQEGHREEDGAGDEDFPEAVAAPPTGQASAPDGRQHLLADGVGDKLGETPRAEERRTR